MILAALEQAKQARKKQVAVLIDPDNQSAEDLKSLVTQADAAGVAFFFVGGSLLVTDELETTLRAVKSWTNKPVLIFPGSPMQVNDQADAILLLSLISGRNPEMLIGHHVLAAPLLKRSQLEIIPTGYMLIDGGKQTTASFMSGTTPIPANKPDIAMATAMAGEMLGLKIIYMDAGSGAENPVQPEVIKWVSRSIEAPIIVGGGITTRAALESALSSGADVVVVGNVLERDPDFLNVIAELNLSLA